MKLDKALATRLRTPMQATWNYIGSDVYQCAAECGERVTNEEAVESCIDANRLADCGHDREADELISALIAEHGYKRVMAFLKKNFKLA